MFVEPISISQENFKILEPIITVSRLFGLFPIKYGKQGIRYKLQWSLGYGIYSYILCFVLTVFTLLGVINDLMENEMKSIRMKDRKGRYVTCCDISVVVAIVVFNAVTLPFKLRKFWKLLNFLNKTDTMIPIKGQAKYRKLSISLMFYFFLFFLLILIFDNGVWAYSTKEIHNTTTFFKNYLSFYVLYCILFVQEVFFWHIVFFIKIRILVLNETLADMKMKSTDKLYRKVDLRPYSIEVSLKSNSVKRSGYMSENIEVVEADCIERHDIAKRVISFIKFQEYIYTAVLSVNSCVAYGVPLIMLSCLLHLIVTPYFLLTEIMKNGNIVFITLQSCWLLIHVVRVLIIVEPCQMCLNEQLRTSVIVFELLTSPFNETEKKALSTFAMQLNCCKIKFTSGGFFKIDRSLLTSVAGAVTTYLVILFQFSN